MLNVVGVVATVAAPNIVSVAVAGSAGAVAVAASVNDTVYVPAPRPVSTVKLTVLGNCVLVPAVLVLTVIEAGAPER